MHIQEAQFAAACSNPTMTYVGEVLADIELQVGMLFGHCLI